MLHAERLYGARLVVGAAIAITAVLATQTSPSRPELGRTDCFGDGHLASPGPGVTVGPHAYDLVLAKARERLELCGASSEAFHVDIAIDERGWVKSATADPKTPGSTCVARVLAGLAFPPKAATIRVPMRFRRAR